MGDILIIQTKISVVKNQKMSIYVHLCCSMGDMLIIQMGRKTNEHEMEAYSMWSCVRVQLQNWKNAYSMWAE